MAVLILLSWTALDLSNVGVCVLDAVEVRVGGEAVVSSGGPASTSGAVPPHVDDCFCCSRRVEVRGAEPALGLAPLGAMTVELAGHPSATGSPLYHPPQLLS